MQRMVYRLGDMSASPVTNHKNDSEKKVCYSKRDTESKCRTFPPINGTHEIQHTVSTGGDALLRAALDTDSSDNNNESLDDVALCIHRGLRNKPAIPEESFEPHETDPSKINAVFSFRLADGSWYIQKDVLPEQLALAEGDNIDGGSIFFPDLETYKVPKRRASARAPYVPWTKTSAWQWERTFYGKRQVWTPNFVFRRFHPRTFEYQGIYVGHNHMKSVDPNNTRWLYGYQKWMQQIKRRSDSSYVQELRRDPWTIPEIRAMYAGINDFIHANGIDAYWRIKHASLQAILDAINKAGGKNRHVDALRAQMSSSHELKNPSMAYLRQNVPDLVKYIEDGGILSDAERFPEQFIPEEEFPTARRSNGPKQKRAKQLLEQQARSKAVEPQMDADDEV